jgi:hypothetical protein
MRRYIGENGGTRQNPPPPPDSSSLRDEIGRLHDGAFLVEWNLNGCARRFADCAAGDNDDDG